MKSERLLADGAVKSAQRALEILEVFDRHRRPLSLTEILDALGYPPSSGSALLKSLLAMGYLDYDRGRRTYFPTMRVALLGRWVEEALFGQAQLVSAMEDLHRRTGEAVILANQSDLHAQYIHLIYSNEPLQFRAQPGLRRPLARSGLGWALLAVKSDDEIEQLRRRMNAEAGEALSRDELMARVAEVRARGYAFSKHTITEGVGVIAMALPKAAFGRVFALAVAGYVSRLERKEADIVAALHAIVARLSQQTIEVVP
jgi:DNA-binding IclR family transcriptional regulator